MRFFHTFCLLNTAVSAHTIFQKLYINGESPGQLVGIRAPSFNGPVLNVTSDEVICNGGPNPLVKISREIINTTAGDEVTAEWHHTLDGGIPGDAAEPVDPTHVGPTMAYLAKVDDARTENVTGLEWFKIFQDGMDSEHKWGVTRLVENKGKFSFKIPACIQAGQYLLRVELIALHGAAVYPGAQLYMECAQLNIAGGGDKQPETVSFPGAYSPTDPGITIN
ncbi:hypothetical protein FKW77_008123 [Venturia effusa]|uniref:AA9 family lytic polysaccharide monooxygenase n=1 Tax=Venturia effusa TaxID=50376 RepID=A0A517KZU1_9PEZI|nr:hypothetical protein FKW77_008123 [Venturia effusa]